ncbi:MAG TPA: class I SAM-dependent methyltransferase [Propionibacteriaceae bacterium]|nr:class I SAM-dependent methyltransferase [Propionibacteriaceae bacterium]
MTAITTANVSEAFDEAAERYDLMVGLNPGYHDHLRSAADALAERLPRPSGSNGAAVLRLADLGCGSGASTRAVLNATQARGVRARIVGVDASAGMLEQARAKRWPPGISFEIGMAEELAFARESWGLGDRVPGVFAAYLFRNVAERDKVLASVFDLLDDDGTFVVQEYSVAGSPVAAAVWSLVCWTVVIPLSWLTSRQTRLYRYLWRSVLRFDSVQVFADRLYGAGFTDVEVRTVSGWQRGILHTFRARKPAVAPRP